MCGSAARPADAERGALTRRVSDNVAATASMPEEDVPQAPSWQDTNEVARDLHRALAGPSAPLVPRSHTADETRLPSHYRIAPSVGTASDNAQPGGFRRAHLRLALGTLPEYASQPLTAHLSSKRWAVVLQLADGTEVRYKSRGYRRGLGPTVLHLPDGSAPPPPPPSVCLLWRPRSISYWRAGLVSTATSLPLLRLASSRSRTDACAGHG